MTPDIAGASGCPPKDNDPQKTQKTQKTAILDKPVLDATALSGRGLDETIPNSAVLDRRPLDLIGHLRCSSSGLSGS
jgi:hypothetical protein